ncbi:MAG: hypothetical protein HFF50_10835 [Lawsonibacter sp.]|nr:hypothetical protein [Lawsonibacter sp.]
MRKRRTGALAAALTLAVLLAGTALAAGGQDDPLVTLSYLNQTVLPQILSQVEKNTAQQQEDLAKRFQEQLSQYGSTGSSATGAAYTLVTLTSGQTMSLELGCEVLLRVGSVTVSADSAPALIDTSSGGTLGSGASLLQNHLYLSTIEGRTLTPTSATVKLMARGGYTIS